MAGMGVNPYRLMRRQEQKETHWSGGITKELMIYPEHADYMERNFRWRISSATVEAETTVFSPLPGFRRILMVLDGKLTLEHENRHTAQLQQWDQDHFDGSWTTRSTGIATDLNVMLSEGCTGSMEVVQLEKGGRYEVCAEANLRDGVEPWTVLYYLSTGHLRCEASSRSLPDRMTEGDCLMLSSRESVTNGAVPVLLNEGKSTAFVVKITVIDSQ